MMVIISLGCICVARKRCRWPAASKVPCHFGANCCQKSSTEQNSSSILISEPPGDKHWFSSVLYLTRKGSLSRTHVILNGQSRTFALREAQLALKKRGLQPYYWGAFICQGNPGALLPEAAAAPH